MTEVVDINGRRILFVTPIDHAWYLGEHVARWFLGLTIGRVPQPPPLDIFLGKDMVGPTLEEALVGTDHRLYLKLEGVSYLESLVPRLINGVARDIVIPLLDASMGASCSSSGNQVCIVLLSVCLCSY